MNHANSVATYSTRITLGDTAARTAVAKQILYWEAWHLLNRKTKEQRRAHLMAPAVQARRAALEAEMTRQHRENGVSNVG